MNPRGRCKKCAAPVTWLRTSAGKWMPVDDASGRVNPSDVFSIERHAAHWQSCPEAKAFRKQQQQQQHAALDEANAKKAVIAKIGKIARELTNVYGIRRDQLQGLARATVGVSGFEHLYAVPVTWQFTAMCTRSTGLARSGCASATVATGWPVSSLTPMLT